MRVFTFRGYKIKLGNGRDIRTMRELAAQVAQGKPTTDRQRKLWGRIKATMQQRAGNSCSADALLGGRHIDDSDRAHYVYWEGDDKQRVYSGEVVTLG